MSIDPRSIDPSARYHVGASSRWAMSGKTLEGKPRHWLLPDAEVCTLARCALCHDLDVSIPRPFVLAHSIVLMTSGCYSDYHVDMIGCAIDDFDPDDPEVDISKHLAPLAYVEIRGDD